MSERKPRVVFEALRSLVGRPETLPPEESEKPFTPYSRGVPVLTPEKCVGCSLCAISCPSQAITMVPGGKRKLAGREVEIKIPEFDYSKCIYCGMCAQVCRPRAIEMRRDIGPIIIPE